MNETDLRIKSIELASAIGVDAADLIKTAEAILAFISAKSGSP